MTSNQEKKPLNGGNQLHINYNTLIKKYGNESVLKGEEYLEQKYPIAYGKADDARKVNLLDSFLRRGGDQNDKGKDILN
ncbi:MAG: hypothetical protein OH335_04810 [Candidatus Parvarchaeota archaeon]|nr:hypothetical protein [Candidatus Jingweiarchaeum tengchongense]